MTEFVAEEIDPDSWLVRQVYAKYGLAIYTAQLVGHGIVTNAVLAEIRDRTFRSLEELDADFVSLFRQTMDALRNTLLARRPAVTELDKLLARAVRLRNTRA